MAHDTFQVGNLTAVIGDNEAWGEHQFGYNRPASATGSASPVRRSCEKSRGGGRARAVDGRAPVAGLYLAGTRFRISWAVAAKSTLPFTRKLVRVPARLPPQMKPMRPEAKLFGLYFWDPRDLPSRSAS